MGKFIKVRDDILINSEEILCVSNRNRNGEKKHVDVLWVFFKNTDALIVLNEKEGKFLISELESIEKVNDESIIPWQIREEKNKHKLSTTLLTRINDLDISVRAKRILRTENIFTLKDLIKYKETDLRSLPNFGRVSLNEIKAVLEDLNLSLAK